MTDRVDCQSCKGPMSAEAARCPHCGQLQARAAARAGTVRPLRSERAQEKPKPSPAALVDVTPEEARAILTVNTVREHGAMAKAFEPNIIEWLFVPHPRSRGAAFAGEVICTLIALPALLLGGLGLIFLLRRIRAARREGSAAAGKVLASFGVFMFGAIFSGSTILGFITTSAAPTIALFVREYLRKRADDLNAPNLVG